MAVATELRDTGKWMTIAGLIALGAVAAAIPTLIFAFEPAWQIALPATITLGVVGVGGLVTILVGAPMWIVGNARLSEADATLDRPRGHLAARDRHRDRRLITLLTRGRIHPTVLSWRFRF